MATASPFLRALPCSLLLLPVLLPAEEEEATWTKLHPIEEIGNIDFIGSEANDLRNLHVDLRFPRQKATFQIDLTEAHQRWCHQIAAPDGEDFPVDDERTRWIAEPATAGSFSGRGGAPDFIPGDTPLETVRIGAIAFADPPPEDELSETDSEAEEIAPPPSDQPHPRVRWWHRPVVDGNPTFNDNVKLTTFKIGIQLEQANVAEDVVWEDDSTDLVAQVEVSALRNLYLATGARGRIGPNKNRAGNALDEVHNGEHILPGKFADEGEHHPNIFPEDNLFIWSAKAGSENFSVERIHPRIAILPTLSLKGVNSIRVVAHGDPHDAPVGDALFAFNVISTLAGVPGVVSATTLIFSDLLDREGVDAQGSSFVLSAGTVVSGIQSIGDAGKSVDVYHSSVTGGRKRVKTIHFDRIGKAAVDTKIHAFVDKSGSDQGGDIRGEVVVNGRGFKRPVVFVTVLAQGLLQGFAELPGQ